MEIEVWGKARGGCSGKIFFKRRLKKIYFKAVALPAAANTMVKCSNKMVLFQLFSLAMHDALAVITWQQV